MLNLSPEYAGDTENLLDLDINSKWRMDPDNKKYLVL